MTQTATQAAPQTATLPPDADVARSVRALGRNLRLVTGGVFGAALLQYALMFWIARVLGVQAFGAFALALSIGMLSTGLGNLGTSVALVHACARDADALPATLGGTLWLRLLLLLPVWLATVAFCRAAGYPDDVLDLVPALFLASFFDGLGTLASSVFQAREEMGWSAGIAIARSALRCAALIALLVGGGGACELALWYALASALVALPAFLPILRRTRPSWSLADAARVLRASAPFALGVVAVLLHGQLDVVLLGWLADVDEVGIYNAASRFLVLAMLLPQAVTTAVAPLVYKLGLHGPTALARVFHLDSAALATIGAIGSLAFALHAELLVDALLGPAYAASAPVLAALAPAVFVRFAAAPLADALQGLGRQSAWGVTCCATAVVNGLADVVLIPAFGALGAAAALVGSQLFHLLVLALALRACGVPLDWQRVLGRPLGVLAIGAAIWWSLWASGVGPRWIVLPATVLGYALLVWRWPTREESVLVRRLCGWTGGAVAARPESPSSA